MLAARMTVRLLAMIAVLLSVAACDDESGDKKTKYDVTIYVSKDIIGEVKYNYGKRFNKPRVEVHHPEGVEVDNEETEPRKTTVVDFAPLSWFGPLEGLIVASLLCILVTCRRYTEPVYQRG